MRKAIKAARVSPAPAIESLGLSCFLKSTPYYHRNKNLKLARNVRWARNEGGPELVGWVKRVRFDIKVWYHLMG